MKRLTLILFACFIGLCCFAEVTINKENCTITKDGKTFKLYGNVQIVESFPDIKVQIVESFADLEVKLVESFPDGCGRVRIVTSFPDVRVKIVDSFPDIKVKIVDSFPGLSLTEKTSQTLCYMLSSDI